jgi:hypothetical protein
MVLLQLVALHLFGERRCLLEVYPKSWRRILAVLFPGPKAGMRGRGSTLCYEAEPSKSIEVDVVAFDESSHGLVQKYLGDEPHLLLREPRL